MRQDCLRRINKDPSIIPRSYLGTVEHSRSSQPCFCQHRSTKLRYATNLKVIQKNDAFRNTDGKMTFSSVQVFVQQDHILYSGKWMDRLNSPKALDDLHELKQISTEDRGPEVKSTWSAIYIKTPSLLAYTGRNLEKQIAREIEIYKVPRFFARTPIRVLRSTMAIRIPTVEFLDYVSNDIRQPVDAKWISWGDCCYVHPESTSSSLITIANLEWA